METKRDLVKIGQEAFELLDKLYPPNRRSSHTCYHQYQSQNPNMVIHQINPSSKVATIEKMTIIRTHEIGKKGVQEAESMVEMSNHREIRASRAPVVVPRSKYQVMNNNVYPKKPAAAYEKTIQDKSEKKSRGGLFLIGGFGRK